MEGNIKGLFCDKKQFTAYLSGKNVLVIGTFFNTNVRLILSQNRQQFVHRRQTVHTI